MDMTTMMIAAPQPAAPQAGTASQAAQGSTQATDANSFMMLLQKLADKANALANSNTSTDEKASVRTIEKIVEMVSKGQLSPDLAQLLLGLSNADLEVLLKALTELKSLVSGSDTQAVDTDKSSEQDDDKQAVDDQGYALHVFANFMPLYGADIAQLISNAAPVTGNAETIAAANTTAQAVAVPQLTSQTAPIAQILQAIDAVEAAVNQRLADNSTIGSGTQSGQTLGTAMQGYAVTSVAGITSVGTTTSAATTNTDANAKDTKQSLTQQDSTQQNPTGQQMLSQSVSAKTAVLSSANYSEKSAELQQLSGAKEAAQQSAAQQTNATEPAQTDESPLQVNSSAAVAAFADAQPMASAAQQQDPAIQVHEQLMARLNEAQLLTNAGTMKGHVVIDGKSEFTMKLSPETLGEITVRMIMESGKLSVTITAQNQATQQLLAAKSDVLADSLKAQSIDLSSFEVVQQTSASTSYASSSYQWDDGSRQQGFGWQNGANAQQNRQGYSYGGRNATQEEGVASVILPQSTALNMYA